MDQPDQQENQEKQYTADDLNFSGLMGAVFGAVLTYAVCRRRRVGIKIPMLHTDLARHVCKDPENAILFPTDFGDCILIAVDKS